MTAAVPTTGIAGATMIVTGGASGIGRGLCERFAADGAAHVTVADLNLAGAQEVADAIKAGGTAATAIQCDASDESSVQALVTAGIEAMGHIDVFCANAGVGAGGGLDVSDELWDLSWNVNVRGPILAARNVIPHMTKRGGGSFVVTASSAGLTTGPTSFNYATSKHAAIGVAEWLAINHGPTIAVSAICPTIVDTPMAPEFGATLVEPMSVETVVDAAIDGMLAGRFLIAPAPVAIDMMQAKAADYDGFIGQLQQRVAKLNEAD